MFRVAKVSDPNKAIVYKCYMVGLSRMLFMVFLLVKIKFKINLWAL